MSDIQKLNFMSDNVWGMHPKILQALQNVAQGAEPPYGNDPITENLRQQCNKLFERDVEIVPLQSGTAANALGLSLCAGVINRILCHEEAHIWTSECGAVELQSGATLAPLPGGDSDKVQPHILEQYLQSQSYAMHHQIASVLSIAQTTESGSIYSLEEIQTLSKICKKYNLKLHMDGARIANAAASDLFVNYSLAEMTWKAGVDVLSFGCTKNGAMTAEAVIIFDETLKEHIWHKVKRAGYVASKMRFVSVQIATMLEDDLWRKLGKHANDLAQNLKQGLLKHDALTLASPSTNNQLFIHMPQDLQRYLKEQNVLFYDWPPLGKDAVRLICSSEMAQETVDKLIALVDAYFANN